MNHCVYCSTNTTKVQHVGVCPRVRALEYYENGAVKRVEFTANDYSPPQCTKIESVEKVVAIAEV